MCMHWGSTSSSLLLSAADCSLSFPSGGMQTETNSCRIPHLWLHYSHCRCWTNKHTHIQKEEEKCTQAHTFLLFADPNRNGLSQNRELTPVLMMNPKNLNGFLPFLPILSSLSLFPLFLAPGLPHILMIAWSAVGRHIIFASILLLSICMCVCVWKSSKVWQRPVSSRKLQSCVLRVTQGTESSSHPFTPTHHLCG